MKCCRRDEGWREEIRVIRRLTGETGGSQRGSEWRRSLNTWVQAVVLVPEPSSHFSHIITPNITFFFQLYRFAIIPPQKNNLRSCKELIFVTKVCVSRNNCCQLHLVFTMEPAEKTGMLLFLSDLTREELCDRGRFLLTVTGVGTFFKNFKQTRRFGHKENLQTQAQERPEWSLICSSLLYQFCFYLHNEAAS